VLRHQVGLEKSLSASTELVLCECGARILVGCSSLGWERIAALLRATLARAGRSVESLLSRVGFAKVGWLLRVLLSWQVQAGYRAIKHSRSLHRSLNGTLRRRKSGLLGEGSALEDRCVKLVQGDPAFRLDLKDALEHAVQVTRDWKNGLEEVPVLAECTEGRILQRRPLPRIPSAGEVDENDTKGPDIVGSRCVTGEWLRVGILILG